MPLGRRRAPASPSSRFEAHPKVCRERKREATDEGCSHVLEVSGSSTHGGIEAALSPAPIRPGEEGGVGVAGGEEGVPQAADGMMQPSSLREYRPGDSMRRIHWRAMARRGEPVVAEWEAGCGEGYEFLVDLRCEDEALERALGRLAGFAQKAREEKVPLTLHTQDVVETYGANHRSWHELWRYLAAVRRMTAQSIAPPAVGTHVVRLTA